MEGRVRTHLSAALFAALVSIELVQRVFGFVLLEVLLKEPHTCILKVGGHDRKKEEGDEQL
jgi:hypothetical protein